MNNRQWVIGIDSWIIQDGNYADFVSGDRVKFAVEFAPYSSVVRANRSRVGALRVEPNLYDLTAQVAAIVDGVTVLDCGILMYADALSRRSNELADSGPLHHAVGDVVSLRAYVGIDPFMYVDEYADRPGMPAMVYSWSVDDIRIDTTPWVSDGGPSIRRDVSRRSSAVIERTNGWRDDEGRASYLLTCTLDQENPTRTQAG